MIDFHAGARRELLRDNVFEGGAPEGGVALRLVLNDFGRLFVVDVERRLVWVDAQNGGHVRAADPFLALFQPFEPLFGGGDFLFFLRHSVLRKKERPPIARRPCC